MVSQPNASDDAEGPALPLRDVAGHARRMPEIGVAGIGAEPRRRQDRVGRVVGIADKRDMRLRAHHRQRHIQRLAIAELCSVPCVCLRPARRSRYRSRRPARPWRARDRTARQELPCPDGAAIACRRSWPSPPAPRRSHHRGMPACGPRSPCTDSRCGAGG